MAKKHTPFVIAYDFDGTLAAGNMQEYDFIPALEIKIKDFWKKVGEEARRHDADGILTYMHLMLKEAGKKDIKVQRQNFEDFGKGITMFPGVEDWFDRINEYGRERQIKVQHFIISSGLREMIQGTSIARHFEQIYASGFMYDQHDVAIWPALAINYTTKTQYLFRINKGSLDVHDNSLINKYVPDNERPVPFANMVFIGDGETDIPCMRLVKSQGGHAIAVYSPSKRGAKTKAKQLVDEGRVNLVTTTDYTDGSNMDKAVKAMINKVASESVIKDAGTK
ncbi:MAG: haloacid dehalogenase-like hydrolase [Burkholderiales bacterium]|nr:haloacid dehalogenase-like hydrolase [Burkholderiales bacterium]